MFYLGEYMNTVTVSAVAVTLFLGGWRGRRPFDGAWAWLWPTLWFVLKVVAVDLRVRSGSGRRCRGSATTA